MEETYLCPDCCVEHAEPVEAVLGHRARCLTCLLLTDERAADAALAERTVPIAA